MITIGAIEISDNMYLGGITQSKGVAHEQVRTVEGISKVRVTATPGGRTLTLGTESSDGSVQGLWCQETIDDLKNLESQALPVVLNHHGDVYTVFIIDTSQFKQMFKNEPVTPTKVYTGKLVMMEV